MGRCRTGRRGALPRGRRKKGLSTALTAEIRTEVATLLTDAPLTPTEFATLEHAARATALAVAARLVREHLSRQDRARATPHHPCACGQRARRAGVRVKRLTTVLGDVSLPRTYYHCAACGRGHCPLDAQLGVAGTALSPGITRMVAAVGATVSFAEGSQLLTELAGVQVPPTQVERTAEALGRAVAVDEQTHVVAPTGPVGPTLYLGVDGTGIPMRRAALVGRRGKQPDGSAKTREVKLCTVWTAAGRDATGTPVRDRGSVTYSAALESAATLDTAATLAPFLRRVQREATRRGVDRAAQTVVLGDGAPWIWNLAGELFPAARQIVDLFHAKETLSRVAAARFGPHTAAADAWATARHAELETAAFAALLPALQREASCCEEARKAVGYFTTNRARMQYPTFRAAGLCVSSGVLEAGCKTTAGHRLKRAGMHWSEAGANAILALRCTRLSGRFDDVWSRYLRRLDAA